jgi:hypothetical protein
LTKFHFIKGSELLKLFEQNIIIPQKKNPSEMREISSREVKIFLAPAKEGRLVMKF